MKLKRTIWIAFGLLLVASSFYRVWDNRPWGFTPQIAMAIFAGSIIKDRKWAFILPLFSMLLSDAIYEVLYINNLSDIRGFYHGQWVNYLLIGSLVFIGFLIRKPNWLNVLAASIAAPCIYFLLSNFTVWASHGGFQRPMTFNGLILCYNDGLPFLKGYLMGTVFFSAILFGGYYLVQRFVMARKMA